MYADTVAGDALIHKPRFVAALFAAAFAAFFLFDFSGAALGRLFAGGEAGGFFARTGAAFVLAFLFSANLVLVGFLSVRRQIIVIWLELAALFGAFFWVFDLSATFIQSKLWFLISRGLTTTLYVSAVSISIAFVIALAGAVAKLSGNGFAIAVANFYTSFFRGLPLLMQVYLIYLGLPQLGFVVGAVTAGITALSLCYGAYMTEIFRAGIESISKGQWEAARAVGLRFGAIMRRIILPQAAPVVIPPTGNQFIAMLKDSSLVSVIGVWELMFLSRTLGTKTFQHMEMLITVAVIYWLLTMVLEAAQSRIEKHYRARR
ncbi:MAG: amino acid ABC transporter permease [Betaproteobacteria bacterium]|nr:amino acid ABC transporter permease [Betaproteobacteria bacterium]